MHLDPFKCYDCDGTSPLQYKVLTTIFPIVPSHKVDDGKQNQKFFLPGSAFFSAAAEVDAFAAAFAAGLDPVFAAVPPDGFLAAAPPEAFLAAGLGGIFQFH